ncbi:hypothetical protein NKR19_g7798 [Coniochaeta hoffmannii]|uniref:Uncharacterized protein n=1 Tax=Coniochaeta hoffmannii TaxID=91930 RepID=A0AA38VLG0_9PEZI|nr:hypothetical protein NKR19_g7798 [Coniochaeta hoffmannii]
MAEPSYDHYLQEYLRRPYSPPPGPAASSDNALRVLQHGLNILARNRIGDPPGGVAVVGPPPPPLPMNGYGYGYYPYAGAQYPPRTVLPAMYYHPGLNNTNIDVTVDINDNLWWQKPGGGGGGSWPNPTVPRPYPHPRPRPDPPPPPPCPGYGCAGAAAAYHCHGTCGGCGHVGCGVPLPYICDNHHIHNIDHPPAHHPPPGRLSPPRVPAPRVRVQQQQPLYVRRRRRRGRWVQ